MTEYSALQTKLSDAGPPMAIATFLGSDDRTQARWRDIPVSQCVTVVDSSQKLLSFRQDDICWCRLSGFVNCDLSLICTWSCGILVSKAQRKIMPFRRCCSEMCPGCFQEFQRRKFPKTLKPSKTKILIYNSGIQRDMIHPGSKNFSKRYAEGGDWADPLENLQASQISGFKDLQARLPSESQGKTGAACESWPSWPRKFVIWDEKLSLNISYIRTYNIIHCVYSFEIICV